MRKDRTRNRISIYQALIQSQCHWSTVQSHTATHVWENIGLQKTTNFALLLELYFKDQHFLQEVSHKIKHNLRLDTELGMLSVKIRKFGNKSHSSFWFFVNFVHEKIQMDRKKNSRFTRLYSLLYNTASMKVTYSMELRRQCLRRQSSCRCGLFMKTIQTAAERVWSHVFAK